MLVHGRESQAFYKTQDSFAKLVGIRDSHNSGIRFENPLRNSSNILCWYIANVLCGIIVNKI